MVGPLIVRQESQTMEKWKFPKGIEVILEEQDIYSTVLLINTEYLHFYIFLVLPFMKKWNKSYCPMKVHGTYWRQRFQNSVSICLLKRAVISSLIHIIMSINSLTD